VRIIWGPSVPEGPINGAPARLRRCSLKAYTGETLLGEVDQQRYPANSSSKALASCKSAVSKPSVNQ
jgi:hypothetical protein